MRETFNILGVTGRAQSGKTTLARALAPEWTNIAFADKLKAEVKRMALQMEPELYALCALAERDNAAAKRKMRGWYIKWGQQRREWDEEYWLRGVIERIKAEPEKKWVISDVRYLNEALAIKALGGVIVRLNRDAEVPDIESETVSLGEIEDGGLVDIWIDNNGTVEDMVKQLNARND